MSVFLDETQSIRVAPYNYQLGEFIWQEFVADKPYASGKAVVRIPTAIWECVCQESCGSEGGKGGCACEYEAAKDGVLKDYNGGSNLGHCVMKIIRQARSPSAWSSHLRAPCQPKLE